MTDDATSRKVIPVRRRSRSFTLSAIALSIFVLAAVQALTWAGFTPFRGDDDAKIMSPLSDAERVWCDQHRVRFGLAAETLELIPVDLTEQPLNLARDDDPDATADLSDATSFEMARHLADVVREAPPSVFGNIGLQTRIGFETYSVLGPRSVSAVRSAVGEWLTHRTSGWDHRDVIRACRAAFVAR